jgi:phage terminase large subunit GpA-like protein
LNAIAELKNDIDFLLEENEKKPIVPPRTEIDNYAEAKRILPSNTPFPGFWRNSRTPYSVEIMRNMGVFSPVQHTVVMKGAQLGLTAASENVIAYWMDEHPAEILYISATQSLLEGWAIKRLEPLIDSCGFRNKIYAQTENRMSRRSGDKIFSKQFVGGNLDMVSAQSASGLRSDSKRILIRDEVDGAPEQLRTGEGNWLDVSFARTNAWGARKKILDISTPTTFDLSLINQMYEAGDRRQYFVPCPYCKKMQVLKFGNAGTAYGIKPERKAGNVIGVYYKCSECHEAIRNFHKEQMLQHGEWRPTAAVSSKKLRSYQLSALYSPIGMLDWAEVWDKFEAAQEQPDGMRSFVNLYLGLPFRESGSRPDIAKVIELRGGYRSRSIPDGVLYLTMGMDVQEGSRTDRNHPARIEFEVIGIGAGYRTWSILYKRINGAVIDPYGGAWQELSEWAREGGLTFRRPDGREVGVSLIFIDSGWGTDIVYRFVSQWQNTFACKGFSQLKKRKLERVDEAGPSTYKRYRAQKLSSGTIVYEISTNFYKTQLYNNLKITRQEVGSQRAGFCDFPIEYGEEYFKQLTAAEKRRDGTFYTPAGRREEALDCRVYALCAADVWLDARLMDFKSAAKKAGAGPADLQKITHRTIIDLLKSKV